MRILFAVAVATAIVLGIFPIAFRRGLLKPLGELLDAVKQVSSGNYRVRLAVTDPNIYRMQIKAIESAMAEVQADVSIMIPQVITLKELLEVKKNCVKVSELKVGIMMETVRACMRAGRLAEVADFFSFGTNDLTQAVYSFSREDVEKNALSTERILEGLKRIRDAIG